MGLHDVQVRWTVMAGTVLSLVSAYGGQAVLPRINEGDPREGLKQALAGSMLIAGALLFGALRRDASDAPPRLEFPPARVSQPAFVWHGRWTVAWLAVAIVLAVVATRHFAVHGESPAVVGSWLISILALLVSQLRAVRFKWQRVAPPQHLYVMALAAVLVIALCTRVYKLTTLPYDVDVDFALVGLQTRALVTAPQVQHIFAYGWAQIPILGYLPPWVTMELFGTGLAGLNASGVIEGLLIIVGVYLLGRDLFHVRVGLIAAALLTVSYAHLVASRQPTYIDPVFFLVFAIYFLLVGLCEGRGWALVTSGILTTLCLEMYYSGRIIVFIIGGVLLCLLFFHRPWLGRRWWAVLLWALAVLITLGPMLVVFIRDIDGFLVRTRAVFILNPAILKHEQILYQRESLSAVLLEQARHTALMFHYYIDTGTQFSFRRPFLDPLTAPLFALGIGYALFCWRRFGYALTLSWTIIGVLIGGFLTADPPNWGRLMILLPPTALLAAVALNRLYELAHRSVERLGSRAALVVPAVLILFLLAVGVRNWNTYVELKGRYVSWHTSIPRYLAEQPPSARAYLVSADVSCHDPEFEFLAPGRLVANLPLDQIDGGDIVPVGSPTLLVVPADGGVREHVQRLRQHFPGQSAETHIGNGPNDVSFYVFRLP